VIQEVGILAIEGIVGVFALISLWIVLRLRSKFVFDSTHMPPAEAEPSV
jgi:hypothetical protein